MTNEKALVLETDRLRLRPVQVEDITDGYVAGLNDTEVNRYLMQVKRSRQTRASVERYVRANLEDPAGILFGIFVKDDPAPFVGTVRVSRIDRFHYFADIGVCLFAKRAWKKGYAREALEGVTRYLFESLGLHYLEAGVYEENTPSLNLFRRDGFVESFRVRNKYRFEDRFMDMVYLAKVNPHFDAARLNGDGARAHPRAGREWR
jgi:ribosomal-protein-alanine N-acetyltransferase